MPYLLLVLCLLTMLEHTRVELLIGIQSKGKLLALLANRVEDSATSLLNFNIITAVESFII
jgi:hypothetical protein